jgi:hypothetical protein
MQQGPTYTCIFLAIIVFGGDQRQQAVKCLRMAAQPFLGGSQLAIPAGHFPSAQTSMSSMIFSRRLKLQSGGGKLDSQAQRKIWGEDILAL